MRLARERRRALPAPPAALDEDGDRDRRVVDRREADEPRVRLARAAELGRAGLAGRRDAAGPSAPAVNCWPMSPSTACLHRRLDRPRVVHAQDPPPAPAGRSSASPAPSPVSAPSRGAASSARRRSRRSTPRAPSGAASRTSRPGRTRPRRAPTSSVNPPGAAAVAVGDLADRGRQVERERRPEPELGRPRRPAGRRRSRGRPARTRCCSWPRWPPTRSSARVAGLRVVAVADPEARRRRGRRPRPPAAPRTSSQG